MLARAATLLLAVATALAVQSAQPLAAAAATGPTAVDDHASLPVQGSVRLAGASNDHAGSAAIQPGLTVFPTDGQPSGSVVSDGGRTIKVAKHGTFTVDPQDGSVTFTTWTGFTGDVAVRYRITDAAGATDDGLLSVLVTANGTSDYVLADFGTEVAVTDLLANDTPGRNADGTPGTLDRGSVRFTDDQLWGAVVSDDGHMATVPILGSSIPLGVATLDDRGLLTWRAYSSTSELGVSGQVYYTARDTTLAADGTEQHFSYTTRVTVAGNFNTDPSRVRTTDDHASTPFDASVTLPGSVNDRPHDPTATIRPALSRFDVGDLAADDYLSPDGRKIRYPGRGTWTINADGTVTYVPRRGFVGTDGVNMMVIDDQFARGVEELVVTVQPGPTAKDDTATTAQNVTTSVAVLADDVPGTKADGTAGSMDRTYVRFPTDGQPAGAVVSAYARTLTVPGQGVYTADRTTGAVSFDPEPGFVGTARPITYAAQDTVTRTDGRVVHNPVTATLTVTVTAVTPVALNNWTSTPAGKPVEVPVLGNDKPGAASAPLVASSLRLRLSPGLPDGSRLSGDARTLVVAGAGTFVARTDGTVVLTPVPGFVGTVPTIGYQVSDANGTAARAGITVQVTKVSA